MATFALPALAARFNPRAALLPVAILTLVMLMVVPIAPVLLDIFFVANIIVALAVLMVAINAQRPLDFSAFPSVLLFATLLRLSLNVASARVVLVSGHKGTAAAGQVIEAFGKFLIGGDYVVGLFVFAILLIINLVVVTKGAGRVSEVSARFTLDAMPGKQMAIDADLNAGLLTADEARTRRAEVATEADFYGSMDGASKFVKGDAVAGLLILGINIAGGRILGMFRHGLSLGDAASIYLLLAIGDGLVAQIPALLLSIAAAMIVTRVSSSLDLAGQVTSQFASARAWTPIAAIMGVLTLLPGMPHLILLAATGVAGTLAWKLSRPRPVAAPVESARSPDAAIDWSDVADTATIGLDLGYGLIGMVDEKTGPLMARITGIRRQLSKALGFVVPLVRVRDSIALGPFTYRILIDGVVIAEDEVFPDDLLALEAGPIDAPIPGRVCKDPSFGLDARWIDPAERDLATGAGYTVVDPSTVIGTHLNHILTTQAHLLLGQDEVQKLLDTLGQAHPQLVAGLVPKLLPLATVTAVLQRLLEEGVPIRDVRLTVGSLAAVASRTSDPVELTELVRTGLGSAIVQTLCGLREPLLAISFDSGLEDLLAAAVKTSAGGPYPFEPALAARVAAAVRDAAAPLAAAASRFAIVTTPLLRRPVYGLLKGHLPEGCAVLSFYEIPDGKAVDVTAVVGGPHCRSLTMDARLGFDTAVYAPARLVRTDPERLVQSHLGLVRKIAWHVHARVSTAIDIEDLIQIGMIALIEAARGFEDRGYAAFATYATVRVRGSMIDQLRKSATLVRSAIRRRREFGAARSSLEGLLGRPASDDEMAERLEMTVEAYRTAANATHAVRYESIDDVYSDHSEWFADDAPSAFDNLARGDLKRAISAAVGALPEREALVLQLYYVEEMNLEEIGQVLDVGAARVCQIKKSALDKLRVKLSGFDA